ncbi:MULTISPECIES: polysaccharide deacetylase family protein [Paenibacillus]|uniref:polysaccharide deacetylase family protein n=1 Tax=Paenibacillus TaxID=44249 RepID=UPI0022B9192B|nr:polysaccharide deacetylase family protein [Paenibacillus caseinilyticus]MCZ8522690.1 polysaccharide deacetylase family protein [Paenibacillus caseinilyticus]
MPRKRKPLWVKGLLLVAAVLLLAVSAYPVGALTHRDQVAILTYHHISETQKSSVTITPELFRRQLTYLLGQGYAFITMQQFREYRTGGSVPKRAVLVTFDDGYESFYEYAYPVLRELGIPAVNFVVTEDLGEGPPPMIPAISAQQIRQIASETDLIEFQCHSHRLHKKKDGKPLLTTRQQEEGAEESQEAYRSRIRSDTESCIQELQQLVPQPVDAYAYPFGMYTAEASELIGSAGIRYGFTVSSRMSDRSDDPMQIPRINAGNPSIDPEQLDKTITRRAVERMLKVDLHRE